MTQRVFLVIFWFPPFFSLFWRGTAPGSSVPFGHSVAIIFYSPALGILIRGVIMMNVTLRPPFPFTEAHRPDCTGFLPLLVAPLFFDDRPAGRSLSPFLFSFFAPWPDLLCDMRSLVPVLFLLVLRGSFPPFLFSV